MTVRVAPLPGLVARHDERGAIEAFLESVAAAPAIFELSGEAGIGKTALLRALRDRALERGYRVLPASPGPTDTSFAYASIGDLLGDVLDDPALGLAQTLPEPQRRALDVALLRTGADDRPIDATGVAMALRSVLVELARSQPVVVLLDDIQWLDGASEQVLRFAFRRLAGRVGVATGRRTALGQTTDVEPLVAARSTEIATWSLTLLPLDTGALRSLIVDRLGWEPPPRALQLIAQQSGGSPFFALELARSIRDGDPTGHRRIPADATAHLRAALQDLSIATRDMLVRTAAVRAPTGREVSLRDLAPAERAGIISIDAVGAVAFTHPMWAATAYETASDAQRRAAHRTLADMVAEPEERARHRALGSDGPGEEVAQDLEDASARAERRGAAQAALELAELALRFTPPADAASTLSRRLRFGRLLAVSDLPRARSVLEEVLTTAPDGRERGEALLELGIVHWNLGDAETGVALASDALAVCDEPQFHGLVHARLSWMRADRIDVAADEARLALETLDPEADPELAGFALLYRAQWDLLAGRGADHPAFEAGIALDSRSPRHWLSSTVGPTWAKMLDQFERAKALYEAAARDGEASGDDVAVASNLAYLAEVCCRTGEWARAEALVDRALSTGAAMHSTLWEAIALNPAALVAALRGRHDEARRHAARMLELIGEANEPLVEAHARAVLGLVALAEGDPTTADRELTRADAGLTGVGMLEPAPYRFHGDHVEAVVALGDLERGERLVTRLESRRDVLPKPWTRVMAARGRALLASARSDLETAEQALHEALEVHPTLGMPFEQARDLLLLGQVLRRRRRRSEAGAVLRDAAAGFDRLGAAVWSARAAGELERLGVHAGEEGLLTPSEDRIARLAGEGLTNREIAARLLISPKTVEANLSRAYGKLGIRTRAELGRWAGDTIEAAEATRPSR